MAKKAERLGDQSHFMYHLGLAISCWQNVERELGETFCLVIGGKNRHIASAAYHSILGLETRLDMTHAAIHAGLTDKALLAEWDRIYTQIDKKRKKRNRLVHFESIYDASKAGAETFLLVPKDPVEMHLSFQGKGPKYDWRHIHKFGESFMTLYATLSKFNRKLVPR